MNRFFITIFTVFSGVLLSIAGQRWNICPDRPAIYMQTDSCSLPHADHVEMSGQHMSVVLYWSLDSNAVFSLNRALVFPMLRTIPNDTHASLMLNNNIDLVSAILFDGKAVPAITRRIEIDGLMTLTSTFNANGKSFELIRNIYPCVEVPAMIESYTLRNTGNATSSVIIPTIHTRHVTDPKKGVDGSYAVSTSVIGAGAYTLAPGDSTCFHLVIEADKDGVTVPKGLNPQEQLSMRRRLIAALDSNLVLKTPDPVIDTEFRYAKIRGAESIYRTKGGLMHGPGGESYYAALWANDQAEYINPFFPFLGYDIANESAINSFRHFARFVNDDFSPLPSSIIAEGDGIWNEAGDRGDAAMIAYGAARYALARADKAEAEELWPLIQWCLEYCHRKLNSDGVVLSDHDELEGRFPAGNANLCTASLYYDALLSASHLAKELNKPSRISKDYLNQAHRLHNAIENYFGVNIQGFDTYRYYDGNDILRSWICIPLVMGINERADATVEALLSPMMYTSDGVLTSQGYPVFWDRATLYTLRGALYAGYPDRAIPLLSDFSHRRLLGEHVPYPVEAWPEGNQRHLSAESGLYCRVITEGLFGIRPIGFKSFTMKPQLPANWDFANLHHIRAFGEYFSISMTRMSATKIKVVITTSDGRKKTYTTNPNSTITHHF